VSTSFTKYSLPDKHSAPASKEDPDPVRRQVALRPAGEDQDVRPLEGQGQDSTQEALVAVHVHVLPGIKCHKTYIPCHRRRGYLS
jgi:hypothetical protein